jgi:hypothetical protein
MVEMAIQASEAEAKAAEKKKQATATKERISTRGRDLAEEKQLLTGLSRAEKRQLEQALQASKQEKEKALRATLSGDRKHAKTEAPTAAPSSGTRKVGKGKKTTVTKTEKANPPFKPEDIQVGDRIYIDWDGIYEAKVMKTTVWHGWYRVMLLSGEKEYKMKLFGDKGNDAPIPWSKYLKPGDTIMEDRKSAKGMSGGSSRRTS